MIAITGATGQLGTHVVEQLLKKVSPNKLILAVRSPDKAARWAALGVQVRRADYDHPDTWAKALAGAEKLLLISSSEVGKRFAQHQVVVGAAREAGVKHIVYTSILRADTSQMALATEHRETEEVIRKSGIPFTFLRNGWYYENYTGNLGPALQHGAIAGSAGSGRIAAASRADYAAAAVAVLTGNGHSAKVYELAGDKPFTLQDLATEVSRQSGKPVAYRDMPQKDYEGMLAGFGVPGPLAHVVADADAWAAQGALDDKTGDLQRLTGQPATSLTDAVRAALG